LLVKKIKENFKKNCLIIIGNFKNKHEKDPFINSKDSYINLLIDVNNKLCKPNNCDVFIVTDFSADYEIYSSTINNNNIDERTLNKNNYKEVTNNIKKIFKSKLKLFEIVGLNKEYVNERNKLKSKMYEDFGELPMFDKTFGQITKLYKALQFIDNLELKNNLKYERFSIIKPDTVLSKPLLFNDNHFRNNEVFCWYFILNLNNRNNIKKIQPHLFNSKKWNHASKSEEGEERIYRFFTNCGLIVKSNPTLCSYHNQRWQSGGFWTLNRIKNNDIFKEVITSENIENYV
jgi:hypothetical protein